MTLQIENSEIEEIFTQGFAGDKNKFFAFIKSSYAKREVLHAYTEDQKRFEQTYQQMKDGSMEMLSEEKAKEEIDSFIDTL